MYTHCTVLCTLYSQLPGKSKIVSRQNIQLEGLLNIVIDKLCVLETLVLLADIPKILQTCITSIHGDLTTVIRKIAVLRCQGFHYQLLQSNNNLMTKIVACCITANM